MIQFIDKKSNIKTDIFLKDLAYRYAAAKVKFFFLGIEPLLVLSEGKVRLLHQQNLKGMGAGNKNL